MRDLIEIQKPVTKKFKKSYMKSFIKLTITITICSIIFSACNKSNTLGKMIPKNALVIVHINEKSMSSKVSWNDLKQTAWFQKMYSDSASKAWMKSLMDNPDSAGIDANSDLIIFLTKSGEHNQVVVEGDIKNAKMFESFNKHLDDKSTASKDGDINLITLHNKVAAGWNDKKFVYVVNAPAMNTNKYMDSTFSTTDSIAPAFRDSLNKPVTADPLQLSNTCKSLFSLGSDMSMEKNERFTALLKEDGDIHVFQNTEEMMKGSLPFGIVGMLKLDVFFKDNVSTYTVNFDNGKITFKQKVYVGKELADVLKKHNSANINTDMIKNIPSQNVAALVATHFNPETVKDIVTLAGVDGFVNLALSQQGLSFDDIIKAIKGDILIEASDVSLPADSSNVGMAPYKKPDVKFLFSTSIGDKNSFNKLLNAGKKLGQNMHTDSTMHSASNDKYYAFGSSNDYVTKYLAGGNNKFDFIDKISGYPVGGFVDIHKLLMAFSSNTGADSSRKAVMDESLKTWDNFYFMGGEFKDNAFTFNGEVNFIDKTTHSLKQLNQYTDHVSKIMIEKDKKDSEGWHTQLHSGADSSDKKSLHSTHSKK